MAFAMLIFMIALGGIPPTAGFMGKMWLFGAAIDSGYVWLAVIGVANSVLSVYYYARVVMWMWMTPQESEAPLPIAPSMAIAISLAAAAVIIGGLFPDQLFTWAESSARALGVVSVAPAHTQR
jgi:NADH-quinone oxidoreductase subunit N